MCTERGKSQNSMTNNSPNCDKFRNFLDIYENECPNSAKYSIYYVVVKNRWKMTSIHHFLHTHTPRKSMVKSITPNNLKFLRKIYWYTSMIYKIVAHTKTDKLSGNILWHCSTWSSFWINQYSLYFKGQKLADSNIT